MKPQIRQRFIGLCAGSLVIAALWRLNYLENSWMTQATFALLYLGTSVGVWKSKTWGFKVAALMGAIQLFVIPYFGLKF